MFRLLTLRYVRLDYKPYVGVDAIEKPPRIGFRGMFVYRHAANANQKRA
jgi:hypothetical protein